ncbi:MAG TPA: hypothetical protein VNG51_09260 [Ktedonobacteraceae bacterium]|nr:hypothetical protein [Ktedonobacteraceae bacterium]
MVSSVPPQQPLCPVCHRADKVKSLEAAYNSGIERFAPPPMPTRTVSMMRLLSVGMVIVGVCIFLIIVLIGSESFGQDFSLPEIILVSVTLICIVAALVLSFVAFTRVQQGDRETEKQYPLWDKALANWGRLRYCSRDDVVFDPEANKTLTEEQLNGLISTSMQQVEEQAGTLVH